MSLHWGGRGHGHKSRRTQAASVGTPTPTPTPAPSWSVQPSISGTPTVGETLTGSDGTISNGTVSARAWLRAGTPIGGATGSTYLLDAADEGELISFNVEATGAGGTDDATSAAVGPIAEYVAPTINAPILSLTSNTTYPPPLVADFDETVEEDDVLRVQSSATFDFASPIINDTSTLDAAAITAGEVTVTGLSSIADPDETYFRGRIERGGDVSDWSNTVKHGDVVAPTITSSASPSAAENTSADTTFRSGTLTANEDIASWTVEGGADAAKFSIAGAVWTLNELADLETKASYAVTFRATDYSGNTTDQNMTLTITDVDEIPTAFTTPTAEPAAALSTQYTRSLGSVSGLATGISVPMTITGGRYSLNGGSYATAATTITNGDTITLEKTTGAVYSTATPVVLNYGPLTLTWSVETLADPTVAAWTNVSTPAIQTNSATTHTFNSVAFGAGLAVIVATVEGATLSAISMVPTGGGTTINFTTSASADIARKIWQAAVTSGNYDVTVTTSSAVAFVAITCQTGTNLNSTVSDTSIYTGGYPGSPVVGSSSLVVPADGLGVAGGFVAGGTFVTWNTGTEIADVTASGLTHTVATFTGTSTPSFSPDGTNYSTLVGAAWSKL